MHRAAAGAPSPRGLALLGVFLLAVTGCGAPQPASTEQRTNCVSWKQEIAPLLSSRCGGCHTGKAPSAGVDVTSYTSVLGGYDAPRWATAGDRRSRLVTTVSSNSAPSYHSKVTDVSEQIQAWVVDCRLSYARDRSHPAGIMNAADTEQFHGTLVRDSGYRFDGCVTCHGAITDASGGAVGVSCQSCHKAGVTACQTCHDRRMTPPHLSHVKLPVQTQSCADCHLAPRDYRDVGHLFTQSGSVLSGAVSLVFGPLANGTPLDSSRKGPPAFDAQSKTCDNIYCHGAVFADSAAKNTRPRWTAEPDQAACGACHGLPPQNHKATDTACYRCHNRTTDAASKLLSGGLHLNGRIDLGDGSGTCGACHGGVANAAPPRDLLGNTDKRLVSIGAHQAHVQGAHKLRGPIPCGDCHVTPDKLDSPGHLDQVVGVFPAGGIPGSVARADGAQPSWDHATARCTDVYCHGNGVKLKRDLSPNIARAPLWTTEGAACGSCHGSPPKDADHQPTMRLIDCVTCHPATMDATGAILLSGPSGAQTSAHINGVVDVR